MPQNESNFTSNRFTSLSSYIDLPDVIKDIVSEMGVYHDGRGKSIAGLIEQFVETYTTKKDLRRLIADICKLSPYPCPCRARVISIVECLANDIRNYCLIYFRYGGNP